MNGRNLEFLYEMGSMRNIQRGWAQHLGMDTASVLEHSMRVMWLALMIARLEEKGDENKIIKMAMVHDIPETRVSDLSYVQKVYVKADEDLAAEHMFADTLISDYREILREYDKRESIEAKIVKDADNLDIDLELKELEERGSKLSQKWQNDVNNRIKIRNEKLYTESAKKIWDEIQNSDPADWHVKNNKWLKIPEAGK